MIWLEVSSAPSLCRNSGFCFTSWGVGTGITWILFSLLNVNIMFINHVRAGMHIASWHRLPHLGFERNKQFHPPGINTTNVVTLGACMQGNGYGYILLRGSWGSAWMRLLSCMFQSSSDLFFNW